MTKKRTANKPFRFTLATIVFLSALSLVFLLFFAYYTSPLSVDVGYDAAFFRLVGQGMLHDKLPYRDFFDMKGPYLFLIEYLGQIICYGRIGIFIVQWINLTLVLIIIFRLFGYAGIEKTSHRVLMLLPCLWVLSITLEGGNLTEEFSLIPLLLSLNLAAKYYRGCARGDFSNKPLWGLIYDIFPCIRYCAWQTHYMLLVPEIEVEMADRLHEDPPKWIFMPAKEIWIPDRIKAEIDRYEVEQTNDTYKLLHLIE